VVKVILRAKLDGGAQICSVLGRSFTVWPCLGFHSDWLAYDDNKYYTNSVSAYQCIFSAIAVPVQVPKVTRPYFLHVISIQLFFGRRFALGLRSAVDQF